ncbi:cytochrome c-like domain-containing protein [Pelagophyceae sp. CCMP2097]|nr:cytochrome c-like domain-containing protein [Pelagophyceae sp. CCMP2097]|mmetsp:Transcript_27626/g.92803  ORF Transcript_27626/g.92803 Transcript_27626/m.92803 type:complete len:161 (-) Transcript_27626:132-614(-)
MPMLFAVAVLCLHTCAAMTRAPAEMRAPAARPSAAVTRASSRRWALGCGAAFVTALAPIQATAASVEAGERLFGEGCAACHAGGGNIVARAKTLSNEALKTFGYPDAASISKIVANGKGNMPGYAEACAPKIACTFGRRFSGEEMEDVSAYVVDQAAKGW